MNKASIKDIKYEDLKNKKILVRVDFNVPIKDGKITNDKRIKASLPTIEFLLKNDCKVILMSHLGRPKGEIIEEARLNPVGKRLEELLNQKVLKLDDCIGEEVQNAINTTDKKVILLENLRFHKGETKNDPEFALELSKLADIYVNDAFGTAHRAHASTEGITKYLPAYAGFLLEKEITIMGSVLSNPVHPFVAIIGGAKVSTKLGVLQHLLKKVDTIIIGGGMVFTFLKSKGIPVGKSLIEEDLIKTAEELIIQATKNEVNLVFPIDNVTAKSIEDKEPAGIAMLGKIEANLANTDKDILPGIPEDLMGVDIGPGTIENFKETLKNARTVIWNGPMGVFENPVFGKGTEEIAKMLSSLTEKGVVTIVGGGDSVAAVEKLNLSDKFTHVSTGGGATLEFLEGIELPGIKALKEKTSQ